MECHELSESLGHGPSRLPVLAFKDGLIAKGASSELTLQAMAVTTWTPQTSTPFIWDLIICYLQFKSGY